MNRRQFLKTTLMAAAAPSALWSASPGTSLARRARVVVVTGKDPAKMLARGISEMGGWKAFIPSGGRVTLKPNAAWASQPQQGGNTDPVLVGACVAACLDAGASRVTVPENPCNPPEQAFTTSGILKAVEDAGGKMMAVRDPKQFKPISIPGGIRLTEADVAADVLDNDCLINMPVAKQHGGATLTLSMKNWMGSVRDRGFWHRNNLHQCIADFSTRIKPRLVILDATRILLTQGPRGPGDLAWPNQLILSTDPVAADAVAATLFKKDPFEIGYIRLAHEAGTGCGDLSRIDIVTC